MLVLFKQDPKKKLNKEYIKLLEEAMQAQRNGDIKTYSLLTEKVEKTKSEIDAL